jgi:hypothetical protein
LAATTLAVAVRDSLLLTGALSAVHLLGFTLVTGGALVANLRMMGVLLRNHAAIAVTRPAGRGVAIGLLISVATGFLLFAPRAVDASANTTFRLKMSLLAAAALFHFTVHRAIAKRAGTRPLLMRAVGATGLLLWTGVAVAGCAYILLE